MNIASAGARNSLQKGTNRLEGSKSEKADENAGKSKLEML